jgi:hypothetical protein
LDPVAELVDVFASPVAELFIWHVRLLCLIWLQLGMDLSDVSAAIIPDKHLRVLLSWQVAAKARLDAARRHRRVGMQVQSLVV